MEFYRYSVKYNISNTNSRLSIIFETNDLLYNIIKEVIDSFKIQHAPNLQATLAINNASLWNLLVNNCKFRYLRVWELKIHFLSFQVQIISMATSITGHPVSVHGYRRLLCRVVVWTMKSVLVESACTRTSSSKAIVRPRGSRATASRASIPRSASHSQNTYTSCPRTRSLASSRMPVFWRRCVDVPVTYASRRSATSKLSNRRASAAPCFRHWTFQLGARLDSDRWHFARWNALSVASGRVFIGSWLVD